MNDLARGHDSDRTVRRVGELEGVGGHQLEGEPPAVDHSPPAQRCTHGGL